MTTNEVVDRLTRFVDDERAGAAKIGVRMIPAPAAAGLVEDVAALLALVARERTLREDAEKERKAHHAEALETIAVWRARAESAERERDEARRIAARVGDELAALRAAPPDALRARVEALEKEWEDSPDGFDRFRATALRSALSGSRASGGAPNSSNEEG